MDTNQGRIIELLREVHLIAFKEIERLNLRIAELESRDYQPPEAPILKMLERKPIPTPGQSQTELLNEKQIAAHLSVSVATVRRWRMFRKGPIFVKIGSAVRYKRRDLETWLNSCEVVKDPASRSPSSM